MYSLRSNTDNSCNNVTNPLYTDNIGTTKMTQYEEEHIYDVIKDDKDEKQVTEPKNKIHSNLYQKNTNKNDDAASIKSDELQSREYCTPNPGNENTVHYSNQSKPKKASKQTAKPVAETHHYQPTINKGPPTKSEYILPDRKCTTDNQYAALSETRKVESHYSSLVVQQEGAYQGLVGQRSLPSEYTIPRTKN